MSNPIVTITMENGDVMKAELYPEIAPNTVNNFISLVKKGFYNGLIFHRCIYGFMILLAQAPAARITASRVSSPRTDLRTTSHTPQAFSPWHVPCSRTAQEASSSSCTKLLRIWTAHTLLSEK